MPYNQGREMERRLRQGRMRKLKKSKPVFIPIAETPSTRGAWTLQMADGSQQVVHWRKAKRLIRGGAVKL